MSRDLFLIKLCRAKAPTEIRYLRAMSASVSPRLTKCVALIFLLSLIELNPREEDGLPSFKRVRLATLAPPTPF